MKVVNSLLGSLEGFPGLMMCKQSLLNIPSDNRVSCLCLGKTHGRFIDVLIQQIIIEHFVVAGCFYSTIGCSLMGKKEKGHCFLRIYKKGNLMSSWWSENVP